MENKENFRADISYKVRESSGKNENSASSTSSSANRKEKRSFKCERLNNIFSREMNNSINSSRSSHNANISKEKQVIENSSRRINSAPVYRKHSKQTPDSNDEPTSSSDLTMFPFDREAIDYERIQRECFAVEDAHNDDDYYSARKNFNYQYDDVYDSPTYEMLDQKIGIFQQYALISRHENERKSKKKKSDVHSPKKNSSWGMLSPPLKNIAQINRKINETSSSSPIPDLKIDFFAESPLFVASSLEEQRTENESKLEDCQKQTSSFVSKNNTTLVSSSVFTVASNISSNVNSNMNGSINVTSNPMSSVCTTPRATIVVQQVRHAIFTHNFSPIFFMCL